MKSLILAFFLTANVLPLLANDEGGTPGYIPDYETLVREGYGVRVRADYRADYYGVDSRQIVAPMPTQAFYMKGQTIYYGYKPVAVGSEYRNTVYAFGYPSDYFRQMMPASAIAVNLSHYAVAVANHYGDYGPGDFVARAKAEHENAVTTVQTTRVTTLPAIGEGPAQPAHRASAGH
jgi:hypothetical protein